MRFLHKLFHGHYPEYEYLGYDKYGFNIYADECSKCKQSVE